MASPSTVESRTLAGRPELAVAALTVMRSYIDAGRPRQGLRPFGRFEHWAEMVRNPLIWLGESLGDVAAAPLPGA